MADFYDRPQPTLEERPGLPTAGHSALDPRDLAQQWLAERIRAFYEGRQTEPFTEGELAAELLAGVEVGDQDVWVADIPSHRRRVYLLLPVETWVEPDPDTEEDNTDAT